MTGRVEGMARVRGVEEKAAKGVQVAHKAKCGKSQGKARCTCSPVYKARFRAGDNGARASVSARFSTLAEAIEWLETRGRIENGEAPPPGEAMPFAQAVAVFGERAKSGAALTRSGTPYSASTLATYEVHLRRWVVDAVDPASGVPFGDMLVTVIVEAPVLQRLATAITANGAKASTARYALAAVRAVLSVMYELGAVPNLPPTVKLPPPSPRRTRTYSDDEVARMIVAAEQDDERLGRHLMAPLLRLLDSSGLRIGEALGLRWGPGGLTVEEGVARVVVESAKTSAGVRTVFVAEPATVASLIVMRGERPTGALVFGDGERPLAPRGLPRAGLRRIAKAAEVDDAGFHAFRRTHATNLGTDPSVDPATLAARLGHTDPAFTARTYVTGRDDRALDLARIAAEQAARRAA